jgi:hypothetical protein
VSTDLTPVATGTRRLRPFGSSLTVRTIAHPVMDAIEEGLARYPEGLDIGGSLQITVDVHPSGDGDPGWPTVATELHPDRLLVRCGSSRATVRYADGVAEMSLAEDLVQIADAMRMFVEAAFTSVHVHHGRLVAVHSALVSRRGTGLMLRGPSGAGKSTLTYACLRRGMSITSDDWSYAPARLPARTFAGYPWRMLMTEDAAARFDELAAKPRVPHPSAERIKVEIRPPEHQQVALLDVHAVVMLDPDERLSLRALTPDEAAARFWANALPTEREHIGDDWVTDLMTRPAYLLGRGPSPEEAARALDDLAVSLR